MKKRLITNGILSILTFVSLFYALFGSGFFIFNGIIIFLALSISSFVMGILTLSMEKHSLVKGLTIASGILAILGGFFIINAIVSFIAASKIKDS